MQRLIVVYNPRSSKCLKIRQEVLEPLRNLGGYQVGKFEVKAVPVDENIAALAKILMDGDLVVLAGGDGTATVGLNAAMRSGVEVTLGVLGCGNFNDFARMLGEKDVLELVRDFEGGAVQKLFPLEVLLDGETWRYAACYVTMGMFAESTEIFDKPTTRGILRKGKKGLVFSVMTLARWYFKNRRREFLAKDIQLGDVPMNRMRVMKSGRANEVIVRRMRRVSDVMFVNGEGVAKVMRGGDYWSRPEEFLVSYGRLLGFLRLMRFMIRSMFLGLPGKVWRRECKVDFSAPEEFEIQAEGEYARVRAREVLVRKNNKGVKVICR